MEWTEDIVQKVWENGRTVPGYDSAVWKKDSCGAWIKRPEFGQSGLGSPYAWEVDRIVPEDGDDIANLQPLQWENFKYKKANYPQLVCSITSVGERNL